MSLSRWAYCSVLSAALVAVGCERRPVWQALSESSRLAQGARNPAISPIFDGKALHLRGARGETLGVQIRASLGKNTVTGLTLPEVAAKVTKFSVRSLEVREPSSDL